MWLTRAVELSKLQMPCAVVGYRHLDYVDAAVSHCLYLKLLPANLKTMLIPRAKIW